MLEARFHPSSAARRAYIVVGHVIVEEDGDDVVTSVKPSCSLARHHAPATMLATLRHLTRVAAPRAWERLQSLRSPHWSFIPLEPVTASSLRDAVSDLADLDQ